MWHFIRGLRMLLKWSLELALFENVKQLAAHWHYSDRPFFQKHRNQALTRQHMVPILSPSECHQHSTNQLPSISTLGNKSAQSPGVRRSGFKPEQAA